jgi:ferrous iron transport protein B
VIAAIPTALVLKKGILKSKVTPFLLELPSYKMPRPRAVARTLWDKGGSFVKRAGTIILAVTILVWAASYFPRSGEVDDRYDSQLSNLEARFAGPVIGFDPEDESLIAEFKAIDDAHNEAVTELEEEVEDEEQLEAQVAELEKQRMADMGAMAAVSDAHMDALNHYTEWVKLEQARGDIENARAGAHLENSYLGRVGHAIEPAVEPLGWDWRIGMAAIASFPAREVIVATLGTIFSLGQDEGEESPTLRQAVQGAERPDGSKLFGLATGLSVMVFFALCAQCAATLAVMRRETNSWKWPIASFLYMTTLAYIGALVTYQVASALGA